MADSSWSVEEAKTARASCRNTKCKQKIAKESVRICRKFSSARFTDEGEEVQWFHFQCYFLQLMRGRKDTPRPGTPEDIEGFSLLTDEQQDEIRACFDGNIPDLRPDQVTDGILKVEVSLRTNGPKRAQPKAKGAAKKGASVKPSSSALPAIQPRSMPAPVAVANRTENNPNHLVAIVCEATGGYQALGDGVFSVGRGNGVNVRDPRCSRCQVELTVDQPVARGQPPIFSVIRRGKNPSFLFQSNGVPVELERGKPYEVSIGDEFGLVCDMFRCRLEDAPSRGGAMSGHGVAASISQAPSPPPLSSARRLPSWMSDGHDAPSSTRKSEPIVAVGESVSNKRAAPSHDASKQQATKRQRAEGGGSVSTNPKKKSSKKKPQPGDDEYESDGPDQYDLADSFIDNGPINGKIYDVFSDESDEEDSDPSYEDHADADAMREARDFLQREKSSARLRQKKRSSYLERDSDFDSDRGGNSDDDADDDDDDDEWGSSKKPKKGKPVCKYGEQCYRTHNAQHTAEFSHPHFEKKNRNLSRGKSALQAPASSASASASGGSEKTLEDLLGTFPQMDRELLESIWDDHDGDYAKVEEIATQMSFSQ